MKKLLHRKRPRPQQTSRPRARATWAIWQARFAANVKHYAAAVRASDDTAAQRRWNENLQLRDGAARAGFLYTYMERLTSLPAFPSPEMIDGWEQEALLALAGGNPKLHEANGIGA